MRTTLNVLGFIVLVIAAYVAYWFYQDGRARDAATAFCDSVAIGSPMSAAADKLGGRSDVRHGFMKSESTYFAIFRGPIFNAYTCELKIADGKVTEKRVAEPVD
jgi:hypothetical protein